MPSNWAVKVRASWIIARVALSRCGRSSARASSPASPHHGRMNSSRLCHPHSVELVSRLLVFDDGEREKMFLNIKLASTSRTRTQQLSEKPLGKVGIRRSEHLHERPDRRSCSCLARSLKVRRRRVVLGLPIDVVGLAHGRRARARSFRAPVFQDRFCVRPRSLYLGEGSSTAASARCVDEDGRAWLSCAHDHYAPSLAPARSALFAIFA